MYDSGDYSISGLAEVLPYPGPRSAVRWKGCPAPPNLMDPCRLRTKVACSGRIADRLDSYSVARHNTINEARICQEQHRERILKRAATPRQLCPRARFAGRHFRHQGGCNDGRRPPSVVQLPQREGSTVAGDGSPAAEGLRWRCGRSVSAAGGVRRPKSTKRRRGVGDCPHVRPSVSNG